MQPRCALDDQEVGWYAKAKQEQWMAVKPVAQLLKRRKRLIFCNSQRVDIARSAPIEIAAGGMMLGMLAPPQSIRSERQNAHGAADVIIELAGFEK